MWLPLGISFLAPTATAAERALIVGVSNYERGTGWLALHGENDVPLVVRGLEARGFPRDQIRVVSGTVTKQQVLEALRQWVVEPGDHLYFHYSGHGQRVTDLSGDETGDQFDEALVLSDTPGSASRAPPGYRGERHLLDDELGVELDRLRKAAGPSGSLAVVLDSCHSGSGTRGLLAPRGGDDFVLPVPARAKAAPGAPPLGGGFGELASGDAKLAPMVFLSAAESTQLANEVSVDGTIVGAYTAALARVFTDDPGLTTWRAVHERVLARMRREYAGQVPQLEGAGDTVLFDGRHATPPFYARIISGSSDHRTFTLSSGRLQGVAPGTVVEVHAPGTMWPTPKSLWATGTVTQATAVESTMSVAVPLQRDLDGAPVFVRSVSSAELVTRVSVRLEEGAWDAAWEAELIKDPLIAVTDKDPHFTLVQRQGTVYVVAGGAPAASAGAKAPEAPWLTAPAGPQPPPAVTDWFWSQARGRVLDRVEMHDSRYSAKVQLVPARRVGDRCEPLPASALAARTTNGLLHLTEGDFVQIRVTLDGAPAFVSLVVFSAWGGAEQIFPAGDAPWDSPRLGNVFDECVKVTWDPLNSAGGPSALESLKVFVSPVRDGIDFSLLLAPQTRGAKGSPVLDLLQDMLRPQMRGIDPPERTPIGGTSVEVTYAVAASPAR